MYLTVHIFRYNDSLIIPTHTIFRNANDYFVICRIQTRRQITNAGTDSVLQRSWKDGAPILESEARPLLPVKRVSSKTIKKDSFLSHGWGAGGMPFSVLYMTPHGTRLNHAASIATGEHLSLRKYIL